MSRSEISGEKRTPSGRKASSWIASSLASAERGDSCGHLRAAVTMATYCLRAMGQVGSSSLVGTACAGDRVTDFRLGRCRFSASAASFGVVCSSEGSSAAEVANGFRGSTGLDSCRTPARACDAACARWACRRPTGLADHVTLGEWKRGIVLKEPPMTLRSTCPWLSERGMPSLRLMGAP